ncbi:MAG: sulfur oxidation c-type cytochrome SoxA, partial [Pikeienuella sp.]
MKRTATAISGLLAASLCAFAVQAGPGPDEDTLNVEGVMITTDVAAPEGHPLDHLYSGWRYRSDETQSLQADDFENPAMVAVEYGQELWETPAGESNESCADCHGDVSEMAGLRAVMPKWSDNAGQPWALEQWINWSIKEHQGADGWKWESEEMLAMTALIGLQSRGMAMAPETGGRMQEWHDKGKDLYYTRVGQLDMSCSNCHEDNYGNMIRADHLSQGQV